jgi:hypothetical protein
VPRRQQAHCHCVWLAIKPEVEKDLLARIRLKVYGVERQEAGFNRFNECDLGIDPSIDPTPERYVLAP